MVTTHQPITKENLFERANGRRYNEIDELPIGWIGQGYGYKSQEAYEAGDNYICYIPEYCYNEETYELDLNCCYTIADFLELTGDERKARDLFNAVDWQHPSSLWGEWDDEWRDE